MAKSFDKMTKDELLEYKKEVEKKLKEKEEAELMVANQCKQIGFTSLMRQAKTDSVLAKKMVEALNKELSANEKKRLQNVIDELNSFITVEPVKDEKQQEKPVAVVQSEQQKENPVVEQKQQEKPVVQGEQQKESPVVPVVPVAPVQQQNNSVAVGVHGEQQQTNFFNNAMTNV